MNIIFSNPYPYISWNVELETDLPVQEIEFQSPLKIRVDLFVKQDIPFGFGTFTNLKDSLT
jgi:hypothetical protein